MPTLACGSPESKSTSLPALQTTLSATTITADAPQQPQPTPTPTPAPAPAPEPNPYSYLVSSSEIATTRKNPGYKSIHASQAQQ